MHGDRSERERLFDEFLEWSDALGLDERIDDLAVLDEHEGWDVAHVKLFLDAGIFVEVAACEDKLSEYCSANCPKKGAMRLQSTHHIAPMARKTGLVALPTTSS